MKSGRGRLTGYIMVLGAAALWATLGLFYKGLIDGYGLSPLTVAFFRAALSFAILLIVLALRRPAWLRVARGDLPFFALFGLVGIAAFYIVYVYAVHLAGMAMAVVLMYTAPAWVTLIAWRFFGEGLDRPKLIALVLAFGGCVLVARAHDPAQVRLNAVGILLGLGAGVTYGLYTIFNKRALRRYNPWTTMLYALGFGTAFLLPVQTPSNLAAALQPSLLPWLALLALGPTLGSALLYAMGLERLPASVASIVATLEPAIAAVLAVVVLGETLTVSQAVGALSIISGVVFLSVGQSSPSRAEPEEQRHAYQGHQAELQEDAAAEAAQNGLLG